jgi:hypothetical protein
LTDTPRLAGAPTLSRDITSLVKAALEAKPGAIGAPLPSAPGVALYKIMGKMFAILESRRVEVVILKCDPLLVDILKEQYSGVGHRAIWTGASGSPSISARTCPSTKSNG